MDYSGIQNDNLNLSLAAIDTETELGERIHSSALKVLKRLNKGEESISLNQVKKVQREVLEGGLDQAGIVLPEAAENKKIEQFIKDILRTVEGSGWGINSRMKLTKAQAARFTYRPDHLA